MIEGIVHPRVPLDLAGIGGRNALPDDVVGVPHELEQAGPDDVRVADERQLHLEAVRHRHVVSVHSGDHVEPAGGHPPVEGRPQAAVARQRNEGYRNRAAAGELVQELGELLANRPVTNDDHLVGTHGLVIDRTAQRPPEIVGPVPVVHRDQQREGFMHQQNVPSMFEVLRTAPR